MTTIGNNTAFQKLREYEKRASGFTPGSKKGGGPSDEWSGVVFGMGDARLACRINRVGEILPCPPSTPVPGAKPWILGLANVRGDLMTVIDLGCYLGGERSTPTGRSRLLSASLRGRPVGLLVEEVFGQRNFMSSDAEPVRLPEGSALAGLIRRQRRSGSESWQELELTLILREMQLEDQKKQKNSIKSKQAILQRIRKSEKKKKQQTEDIFSNSF